MRLRMLAIGVLLIGFVLISRTASADSVAVQNASFEQIGSGGLPDGCGTGCAYGYGPVPGWTGTGGGQWQLGATGTYFNQAAPDGSTVAFINGTLSQDLDVTLLANTQYTLTVDVGDRLDGFNGGWSIALDGGAQQLCTNGGQTSSIPAGTFADESCTFTTGSVAPSGDLFVVLGGSGLGDDTTFDNVRVSAPEPESIVLLGAGLFCVAVFGVLYKRNQSLAGIAS